MKRILYIILLLPFFSCQEEVILDLATVEPIPVIEAVWTDSPTGSHVTVSLSKDYYSLEQNELVKDAEVYIINTIDKRRFNFRFSPQANKYLPINSPRPRIGNTYELHVRMGEKKYFSKGTMLAPPTLDSITYNYREERAFREEGYYLTIYGKIPFTEDNNYRVKIVRNDTLLNRRSDYLLFDDTFGTSILNNGLELSGFAFQENDKVRLELFRLNQDAYDYISQLVNLLFNDGGLFSPPPQNPKSNIILEEGDGEVLGYFLVSPVLTKTINIVPDN